MTKASTCLFYICMVFLISACGGGRSDGATDQRTLDEDITVAPSVELYGEEASFLPSQVVYLESVTPFEEGVVTTATGSDGQIVEVMGMSDGTGMVILPSNLVVGTYKLQITGRESVTFTIDSVSFPLDSELYVLNYTDQLAASLELMISERGESANPAWAQLLSDLQNAKDRFDTLSDDEFDRLARLVFVIMDGNSSSELRAEPLRSSQMHTLHYASNSFSLSACNTAKVEYLANVVATVSMIGVLAAEPSQLGKWFLGAGFAVLFNSLLDSMNNVLDECPNHVVSSLIRDLNYVSTGQLNLSSLKQDVLPNPQMLRYAEPIQTQSLDFYDGDTQKLSVMVTIEPNEESLSYVNKIKSLVNMISEIIPSDLLVEVNSLGKPVEKDISGESEFEQVNTSDVLCTGNASAYTCAFNDDTVLHDEIKGFNFKVAHPLLDTPISQAARVLPRDVPLINNQTFTVTPGHGQVNRLVIKVIEDVNSPDYELTKVTGWELVTRPTHGVILNEFNEPGVLDYAADITDDMPESESFEVRVSNRYGYSQTATITLNISSQAKPEIAVFVDGNPRIGSAGTFSCTEELLPVSKSLEIRNTGPVTVALSADVSSTGAWQFGSSISGATLRPGESVFRDLVYVCSESGEVDDQWNIQISSESDPEITTTVGFLVSYPDCFSNSPPQISFVSLSPRACTNDWYSQTTLVVNFNYYDEDGNPPASWLPVEGDGSRPAGHWFQSYDVGLVSGEPSDGEYWSLSYSLISCTATDVTFAIRDSCNAYSNSITLPPAR